jgi:cyclopropane-fatty-acyl-phospholipid synthase
MKARIDKLFNEAGITVNGSAPYDIKIHDERFYKSLAYKQLLGAGESYMAGWWDCEALDEATSRLIKANAELLIESKLKESLKKIWYSFINQQSKFRSTRVAEQHYNLDRHLYEAMLGKTMAYTCGYWRDAVTLDAAQNAKFDLICRKIKLKPKQHILDLGCGWGGLAKYAAENYDCTVTAVNISTEQVKYATESCRDLPVSVVLADYRDHAIYNPNHIHFDHVVSVGLCEHVGVKNFESFFDTVKQQLKPEGLFLLHTIGSPTSVTFTDAWIQKYIFPNSMLPSINQLSGAMEARFILEDLHNFGPDYDRTLMAWDQNFVAAWPALKDNFSETFYRMWRYYLLTSAGAFRARSLQLWQFVLSPQGVPGGYRTVR